MNYWGEADFCTVCLSSGRRIRALNEPALCLTYTELTQNMLPEVPHLCWVCTAMLKKASTLKKQLQRAMEAFATLGNRIHLNEAVLSVYSFKSTLGTSEIITHDNLTSIEYVNNDLNVDCPKPDNDMEDNLYLNLKMYTESSLKESTIDEQRKKKICEKSDDKNHIKKQKHNNKDKRLSKKRKKYSNRACPKSINKVNVESNMTSHLHSERSVDLESHFDDFDDSESNNDLYSETKIKQVPNNVFMKEKECLESANEEYTEKRIEDEIKKQKESLEQHTEKRKEDENSKSVSKNWLKDLDKYTLIKLSMEDILLDRERKSKKESYIKMQFKCEHCVVGFDYKGKYDDHISNRHNKKTGAHLCDICKSYFASAPSLSNHRARHERRFQCALCARRSADKAVVLRHHALAHGVSEASFTCVQCGHISKSLRNHSYHERTHGERPQCHLCGVTFTSRNNLRCHLLRHEGTSGRFDCAPCGKSYRGRSGLAAHNLAAHSAEGVAGRYYCATCDIHYRTGSSYGQHLRTSRSHVPVRARRYACTECEQRFATAAHLRRHERLVHRRAAPHACAQCGKSVSTAWHLARHVRFVHERAPRPRDHVCDVCGQACTSKSILIGHMRVHSTSESARGHPLRSLK